MILLLAPLVNWISAPLLAIIVSPTLPSTVIELVVDMPWLPKEGLILEPAIAAEAFTSALTISNEANFDLAIAALAFISAFTILPSTIAVSYTHLTLPTIA